MNKKTGGVIIALLVILIALVAYGVFKPKQVSVSPVFDVPTQETPMIPAQPQTATIVAPSTPSAAIAQNAKLYKASGFSFQYDKDATVEVQSYSSGSLFYNVFKVGGVMEWTRLFNEKITSYESFCGPGNPTHTFIANNKTFTYCDSRGEPGRTYFYEKNGKTVMISTQGTNGKAYSNIIPESVEID
ncbi:MAG: hypothetical protein JWM20_887 [Patescibacteria group bacterium]|nr:hypothetical protein [Patescibacteria group bacterium]